MLTYIAIHRGKTVTIPPRDREKSTVLLMVGACIELIFCVRLNAQLATWIISVNTYKGPMGWVLLVFLFYR